jgi:hypothetical protein
MVFTNNSDKDINIQDWWDEHGLNVLRNNFYDDQESSQSDIELKGTPREMLQQYGEKYGINEVENIHLLNDDEKIIKPNEKIYANIYEDPYECARVIEWNNRIKNIKLNRFTIDCIEIC